jgi:hypothetical protein
MAGSRFFEVLKAWENSKVTIINPESYSITKLSEGISFESYEVQLLLVTEDYIQISFAHKKGDQEQPVEQYVPMNKIKRVSLWGDQKFVQI